MTPERALVIRGRVTGGFVLLVVLVVGFVNRSDLPVAVTALRNARPGYVVVGLILVMLSLVNQAAFHAAAQRAAGQAVTGRELIVPVAAAGFLNVVVKSGAMAGLAPMLAEARRNNRSRPATVAGYLLVNVLGHLAFGVTLAFGVLVLVIDGRFTRSDAIAGLVFVVLTTVQFVILGAALRSRAALRSVYAFGRKLRRPFGRATHAVAVDVVAEDAVAVDVVAEDGNDSAAVSEALHREDYAASDELFEAVSLVRSRTRAAMPAVMHSLLVEVLGIAELWCVLGALGIRSSLTVPLIAYAVSVLFTIVGFLPGGIGFVEVGLGTILVSSGLARTSAVAAVVLYRVFEFWLPLLGGLLASRVLAARSKLVVGGVPS